ncbi:hemin ABC transporter substrate-binding protein, partial [Streptomyces goshikiensis]
MPTPAAPPRFPRLVTALAALALTLAVTGCGGAATRANSPAPTVSSAPDRVEPLTPAPAPALPVTVTSADGTEVTVTSAERVIPLTGSLNEIVQTLGLGDRVVARDITATFEQAAKLPVVTRGHDVSAESVLSLRPTLVLAETTSGPAEAIRQIRDAGIPLLVIAPAKSLDDVPKRIETVAGALGVRDAGVRLKQRTAERIAAARKDIPGDTSVKKPRVSFLYLRG